MACMWILKILTPIKVQWHIVRMINATTWMLMKIATFISNLFCHPLWVVVNASKVWHLIIILCVMCFLKCTNISYPDQFVYLVKHIPVHMQFLFMRHTKPLVKRHIPPYVLKCHNETLLSHFYNFMSMISWHLFYCFHVIISLLSFPNSCQAVDTKYVLFFYKLR
jgi:hypothetical protein